MSDNARLSDAIRTARKFGNVIRASWVDSPEKSDPGVGFSRFISRPASRFIGGLQPLKPGNPADDGGRFDPFGLCPFAHSPPPGEAHRPGAGIVLYCVLAFWGTTFGFSFLPREMDLGPIRVFSQSVYTTACPPTREQWHQEDLFKVISQYPETQRDLRTECLDTIWFNGWGFSYYSQLYGVHLGNTGAISHFLAERKAPPISTPPGYDLLRSYDLPDQTRLCLYKTKDP